MKHFTKRLTIILSMTMVALFLCAGYGLAKDWPSENISLIYHSKAGSGGDMFLRALAKAMEPDLGKSIIVVNKPGAAAMNAWKAATRAKDGHTFLGVSSTMITSPILNDLSITYESFDPVAMMFVDPMVLFVHKDRPWNTIEDFVADAKKNPGKFNIAGGVPGELGFVAGMLLMQESGIKMNIVPFESGADAAVSVLGGHVDGAIGEYGEAVAQIESGDLKVLVGFNPVEGTNIRTVQDAGFKFSIEKFRGILAPKNTSPEAIERIVQACRKALKDPDFVKYYQNMKLVPTFKTGADFTKVMENQDAQIKGFMEGK